MLTIFRYMKKTLFCLFIYCSFTIVFSFSFLSLAEGEIIKWGNIELYKAEGAALEKAEKNLLQFELITSENDIPYMNIYLARQRNDKVIVWYGKRLTSLSYICVYTPEGRFEFGYKIQFSKGNDACWLNVDENGLYIYLTNADCVYFLNGDLIEYYDVHPKLKTDMLFEGSKMDSYGSFHISYTKSTVTVIKDQKSVTIIDIPKSGEKIKPPYKDLFFWLAVISTCLVTYIIMRK